MFHSDFMRIMSRYKKVVPPILKTQMIQKMLTLEMHTLYGFI